MTVFQKSFNNYTSKDYFLALMALGFMFGMSGFIFGKAMISVSYIHFGVLFLVYYAMRMFKPLPNPFTEKNNTKSFIAVILLALPAVIGCFYSENLGEGIHVLTLRAQLILIPIFILGLPALQKIHLKVIFSYFIILITLNSFFVLHQFVIDPQKIIDKIAVGKSFTTPLSHIRYSVLVALSAWFSLYFTTDAAKKSYKILWLVIGIWLSIFIHIIAVKTGVLLWYMLAFFTLAYYVKIRRFNRKVVYGILGISLFAVLAITFSPPLRQKIDYFKHDMEKYQEGKGQNYSDSERLYAIDIAWDIFLENPILGTGTGDFAGKQMQRYAQVHPTSRPILPHSDWITTLASNGIVGLIIFTIAFFTIFFYKRLVKHPLFMMVFLGMLISTLVDNLFATSAGTAMFVFYTLIFLSYYSIDSEKTESSQLKI